MIGRGCKSMQRLISASLDGELSPEDEQRLQVHLDNCHECRQTRDVYRANRDLIQRNLPGNAEPPQFVTDEILRKTREISNSTGLRRLILGSRLRLTMSVVATIAVAIIASSFFLVQNYRNGISPTIAGSSPQGYSAQCKTDQVARNWPINSPVKITFDRPMNHTSVLKNLSVYNQNLPPGGLSTLPPTSWDGNTLIIGQNPTKTAAWAAGTYYAITVMPQAKGTNGKALGTTRFLCFLTASSISANNLSVTPTASASSTTIAQVSGTKTATQPGKSAGQTPDASGAPTSSGATQQGTGQAQNQANNATEPPTGTSDANSGATGTSTATNGNQGVDPSNTVTNTPSGNAGTNGQPDSGTKTSQTATTTSTTSTTTTSSATETPNGPTATPTSATTATESAASTGTSSAVDATPTGSADATSSSTSTGTSTATSTATQTSDATSASSSSAGSASKCTLNVSPNLKMAAAFGSVFWPNADVCTKLGVPIVDSSTAPINILTFQRGVMIECDDTKKIYILTNDGTGGGYTVVDAPSPSVADASGTAAPAPNDNLWIPGGDLGKVWSDSKLLGSIGYATSQAVDSSTTTPFQVFPNGWMVYSDSGWVYVLYSDNTWQVYPDTSGHGALLETPTATAPAATPTVSPTTAP